MKFKVIGWRAVKSELNSQIKQGNSEMQKFKLSKFVFFNVILPFVDIGTEVHAFLLYLFYDNNPNWAYLTLLWIFNPFLVYLGKFAYILLFDTKNADSSSTFLL